MVSVKQCVYIVVLLLSIWISSSVFVDCHRLRKHKHRNSAIKRRSQSSDRIGKAKTSLEDCVDCNKGNDEAEVDFDRFYPSKKRKSNIRRRKTKTKTKNKDKIKSATTSKKESGYSLWNIFSSVSNVLWSDKESDGGEKDVDGDVPDRKHQRLRNRNKNKNSGDRATHSKNRNSGDRATHPKNKNRNSGDGSIHSDSNYVNDERRNDEEDPSSRQQSRRKHYSAKRRRKSKLSFEGRDQNYDDGDDDIRSTKRRGKSKSSFEERDQNYDDGDDDIRSTKRRGKSKSSFEERDQNYDNGNDDIRSAKRKGKNKNKSSLRERNRNYDDDDDDFRSAKRKGKSKNKSSLRERNRDYDDDDDFRSAKRKGESKNKSSLRERNRDYDDDDDFRSVKPKGKNKNKSSLRERNRDYDDDDDDFRSAKRRGKSKNKSPFVGSDESYDNDVRGISTNRRGSEGQFLRGKKRGERGKERQRKNNRIDENIQNESRRISGKGSKILSGSKNRQRQRYRGRERGNGKRKPSKYDSGDVSQRDEQPKNRGKHRQKKKKSQKEELRNEDDFVETNSRSPYGRKYKGKKNRKKTGGQLGETVEYPLVRAELQPINEIENIIRRRKNRKHKTKDENDNGDESMSLDDVNEDSRAEGDRTGKRKTINKGKSRRKSKGHKGKIRRKGKKFTAEKDNVLKRVGKTNRKDKNRDEVEDVEKDSGAEKTERKRKIRKGRRKGQKGSTRLRGNSKANDDIDEDWPEDEVVSTSTKEKERKDRRKSPNKRKKYSGKENKKNTSLSGMKDKIKRKKKHKSDKKTGNDENSSEQKDATIQKYPNQKMKKRKDKTDSKKSEQMDSTSPARNSKSGKKKSKSKSGKRKSSYGRSSLNKAFSIFTNSQRVTSGVKKPSKPISKSEAERQVDALTDDQIRYALKVAEKRFKRTDRRIKRKLAALKEMTIQHLQALETLEMSLDAQSLDGDNDQTFKENLNENHDKKKPMKPSSDNFKSTANSFLRFASRIPQKSNTFVTEDDYTLDVADSRPKLLKGKGKGNAKVYDPSSDSKENVDETQDELSSNGSKKKSNRKSGRKRKKQNGKKKSSPKGKSKVDKLSTLKNIFQGKKTKADQSTAGSRKRGRLTKTLEKAQVSDTEQQQRTQEKAQISDTDQSTARSRNKGRLTKTQEKAQVSDTDQSTARSRNNGRLTKTQEKAQVSDTDQRQQPSADRLLSKSQRGRQQPRRYNYGNRRDQRYQYLRHRNEDRQVQRVLPRLNREIRKIKQRLHHVLQPFNENLKMSNTFYHAIFNTTRYDILLGAREILKKINNANDDVYDAVMRSSRLTRSIYMKARKNREARIRRPNVQNEEARERERIVESTVKRKNFRPKMLQVREHEQTLMSYKEGLKMMEMKARQIKSRYVQVNERFLEKYDHYAMADIFNSMRGTIDILNSGIQKSYPMTQLHQSKQFVKYMRDDVAAARSVVANSSAIYRLGVRKFRENERLVWNVKREKRNLRSKRTLSDMPSRNPGLTSYQYDKLQRLSVKAKQHAQRLSRDATQTQRILGSAIQKARVHLRSVSKVPTASNPWQVLLLGLKTDKKNAISSLEHLRKFVGGKLEITWPMSRACNSGQEGSGIMNSDDEDLGCVVEGSGMETSGDMTFVDSEDDDFIFDRALDSAVKLMNPFQSFGKELKVFTSRTLNTSRHQFNKAQVVIMSLQVLKDRWNAVENSGGSAQKIILQKAITDGFITGKRNSTEINDRIDQVNQKINRLKEIDFDELHAKAEAAIVKAKERMQVNKEDENDDQPEESEEGSVKFGVADLLTAEESIMAHRISIRKLETFALDTIEKSNNSLKLLRGNIIQLKDKVKAAQNLLNSMQLSILKEGNSPIISMALSDQSKATKSLTTSFSLCIKPQTLDGTVFYSAGNHSVSYALQLNNGELSATVYDENLKELTDVTLDEKIEENEWHTISLLRVGQTLNLTATRKDKFFFESVEVKNMPEQQSAPSVSYIGGVPQSVTIDMGDSWEGCVGEVLVNERVMNLFNPTMDGNSTSVCSEHCVSKGGHYSWIFNGDGFVHYAFDPRETVNSLTLQFRSRQSNATILSFANKRRNFYLMVTLDNGAVQIESVTPAESVFLLSLNNSYNDGNSHTIKIIYRNRGTYSELDGNDAAFSVETSNPMVLRRIKDGVLLGAFLSDEELIGDLYRPLIGCAKVVSINGISLTYEAILQSHNVYYGKCNMNTIWQSCVHFPNMSIPLSLGEIENSNKVSMLVMRNSTGPLLLYVRDDDIDIELSMTDDGIDVKSNKDKEATLIRPEDYQPDELFDRITVEDDGSSLIVSAFGESTDFSYLGWFSSEDLSKPHTIEIGQTIDESDQDFFLSISEFFIGGRMYDLTKHISSSTRLLKACEIPDIYLKQNFQTESTQNI